MLIINKKMPIILLKNTPVFNNLSCILSPIKLPIIAPGNKYKENNQSIRTPKIINVDILIVTRINHKANNVLRKYSFTICLI